MAEKLSAVETTVSVTQDQNGFISATGSKDRDFSLTLINQASNTLWLAHSNTQEEKDRLLTFTLSGLLGVAPKDEIEGMLAAQMMACHNASMECYRRAMHKDQTFVGRNQNLNHATKLTRSYASLMEALNRHRGKGQQKVTVEHVQVHSGGQAIVGNVEAPGGGLNKKIEGQAHAKQVEHASIQAMPGKNTKAKPVSVPCNA